jgi:hypothetical protein
MGKVVGRGRVDGGQWERGVSRHLQTLQLVTHRLEGTVWRQQQQEKGGGYGKSVCVGGGRLRADKGRGKGDVAESLPLAPVQLL